jgi:hypothetical protein
MLCGAEFAVCSEISTKQISTFWAVRRIVKCQTGWCTKPVGFETLMYSSKVQHMSDFSKKIYFYESNDNFVHLLVEIIQI